MSRPRHREEPMPKDVAPKDKPAKEAAKGGPAPVTYKCLRCGHSYDDMYDQEQGPIELTCPKCKSNSVRRIKKTG